MILTVRLLQTSLGSVSPEKKSVLDVASIWKRRRRTIIAVFTILISIILIAVGAPRIFPPTTPMGGTLKDPVHHLVNSASQKGPGYLALVLPGVLNNQSFSLIVNASRTADFCVLSDVGYHSWADSYNTTQNPGSSFPWNQCQAQSRNILQAKLSFTPPTSGTWDVVVLNSNPTVINVDFLPAR